MEQQPITPRQSKYCRKIMQDMQTLGHATNAELHHRLQQNYPELSATTVHRATSRLAERGSLCLAPPTRDGSTRYDANTTPHDHFICAECGMIQDIYVKDSVIPLLKDSIKECCLNGNLTISGTCKSCNPKPNN